MMHMYTDAPRQHQVHPQSQGLTGVAHLHIQLDCLLWLGCLGPHVSCFLWLTTLLIVLSYSQHLLTVLQSVLKLVTACSKHLCMRTVTAALVCYTESGLSSNM